MSMQSKMAAILRELGARHGFEPIDGTEDLPLFEERIPDGSHEIGGETVVVHCGEIRFQPDMFVMRGQPMLRC